MRVSLRRLLGSGLFALLAAAVTVAAIEAPSGEQASHLARAWRLWQVDRVAVAFVNAVAVRDSADIARVSKSGSGHNILCATRLWPRQHWVPAAYHSLYRLGPDRGEFWYRLVGFTLPENTAHAVFDFSITAIGVPKVAHFASVRGGSVMTEAFQACLHQ